MKNLLLILLLLIPSLVDAQGLLRRSGVNPRYFVAPPDTNWAQFLVGNHFWLSVQDQSGSFPPSAWPFSRDMDTISFNHNNFVRLWGGWSQWRALVEGTDAWYFYPTLWYNTGSNVYNLDSVNQDFVDRTQERLDTLKERGVWGAVKLFEGWSIHHTGYTYDTWQYHPMNNHNTNSIAPASQDIIHYAPSNGGDAAVWAIWVKYIKRMVDSLQFYDNFIWEIGNEIADYTGNNRHYAFVRLIIDTLKAYEGRKPKQHAIWNSGDWYTLNDSLFASRADAVGPGAGDNGVIWGNGSSVTTTIPDSLGSKAVLLDTDHLWGMITVDGVWYVWRALTHGAAGVVLQDNRAGTYPHWASDDPNWPAFKRASGVANLMAQRVDLLHMAPSSICSTSDDEIAGESTGEVLVYQETGDFTINLTNYGTVNVLWVDSDDIQNGNIVCVAGTPTAGGASRTFTPPDARYDVLYLYTTEYKSKLITRAL